jgi:spore germination cell wall hydrolase CwlJ-like protein
MITTRKLLGVLLILLILAAGSGASAYAAELTTADTQTTDMGEAEEESTAADVTAEDAIENITNDITGDTTDDTAENTELVLEPGYYIDEQGQVYYDPSLVTVEEPVIGDIPEDAEEDAEDQETAGEAAKEEADGGTGTQKQVQPEVKKPAYSEEDLRLLACLVYAEAGNQSYTGMLAVANVVLNRVKSDVFWHAKTIKAVIYDHKWAVQFSVTIKNGKTGLSMLDKALNCYDTGKFSGSNPQAEKEAMDRAIKVAKHALNGKNNIGDYLCFTSKYGSGSIKKKYPDYKIIGDHIFYRTK